MAGNTFGTLFKFTTFGESHGEAIGCVVDGVPPRIPLTEEYIQQFLDMRRPGTSEYTTPRNEPDKIRILSGVFEGMTTGTPIGLIIENTDTRSHDYGNIKDTFRPGHADYTYFKKYGIRDYRGGGRSSARETAMRVAAGAIARKILEHNLGNNFSIKGAMVSIGKMDINRENWNWEEVHNNPLFCPDVDAVESWKNYISEIIKDNSSVGGIIEVVATGIPAGLGEPVYDKLDADIAKAMISINAVKGVEIGLGFEGAQLTGEENSDEMVPAPSINEAETTADFLSNNAGGILGGISTGQPIVARVAVKPTSSINKPQKSIDINGTPIEISTQGRHDPCVAIRGVPVVEAMMACTLADHFLRNKALCN
ncbi:MAG: chorismate synthase [Alphaproteobacteria bacterium]|nr:chorismate synthase [Alphaproteobacteria bacterium]